MGTKSEPPRHKPYPSRFWQSRESCILRAIHYFIWVLSMLMTFAGMWIAWKIVEASPLWTNKGIGGDGVSQVGANSIGDDAERHRTTAKLLRLHLCRDACYRKFATDDISCLQAPECSTCWDDCSAATKNAIGHLTSSVTWPLSVTSMVRDGSLVTTNVAWHSAAPGSPMALSDCLVTWEVQGGGLIGNLLTSTPFVELSLWTNTKYRIQVTCKRKESEDLSRSDPLTLDTSDALVIVRVPTIPPARQRLNVKPIQQQQQQTSESSQESTNETGDDESNASSSSSRSTISKTDRVYLQLQLDGDADSDQPTHFFRMFAYWLALTNPIVGIFFGIVAGLLVVAVLYAYLHVTQRRRAQRAAAVDKTPLVDAEVAVHVDAARLTIHV